MAQIQSIRLPGGQVVSPGDWTDTPLYSTVEIGAGAQQELQAFSYGIGGDVPGSVGPRKATIIDTNMRGPGGVLAENEHLLIFSIQLEGFLTGVANLGDFDAWALQTVADAGWVDANNVPAVSFVAARYVDPITLAMFQRNVLVQLRVAGQSGKHQIRVMPGFLPAGQGITAPLGLGYYAPQGGQGPLPIVAATNGSPDRGENRQLATVHEVAPGEQVSLDFQFPDGAMVPADWWGNDTGNNPDVRLVVRSYFEGYRRRPVA